MTELEVQPESGQHYTAACNWFGALNGCSEVNSCRRDRAVGTCVMIPFSQVTLLTRLFKNFTNGHDYDCFMLRFAKENCVPASQRRLVIV